MHSATKVHDTECLSIEEVSYQSSGPQYFPALSALGTNLKRLRSQLRINTFHVLRQALRRLHSMWRPEMSWKEVVQLISPFPFWHVTIERLCPSPAKGLGLELRIISATRPRGRNGTAGTNLPFTPLNGNLICLLACAAYSACDQMESSALSLNVHNWLYSYPFPDVSSVRSITNEEVLPSSVSPPSRNGC